MASFTDQVPTFNPYVSQQPVDAMVQVGMMKQQQYDTNLQKIQQTMSSISGLQIGRDVDKQYLEKKISDMNTQLTGFASADLSSNRLTTHIRSMVGGIAQDEVVQNSVRSTMAAQSAKSLQSKYNSEGKGSPSNDFMLNRQLQKWYEDETPGANFSGTYTPYHDYHTDSIEAIKAMAKDYHEGEVALDYDDKGNIVGVRDAISKTVIEGITPQKIQTALQAGLSPAAWNQVQIDGIYQYSGVDDSRFIKTTRDRYTSILDGNQQKINRLEALSKNANPSSKIEINEKIKSLEEYNKSINREFSSLNKQLDAGDFDGAKAKLFTIDWMNNMANAYSSTSVKKTYETNPIKTVQLAEAKMAQDQRFKIADLKQKDYQFRMNYGLKLEDQNIAKEKNRIAAEEGGKSGRGQFGNIEMPTTKEEVEDKVYINQKTDEIEAAEKSVLNLKTQLLEKHGLTEEDLENYITQYKSARQSVPIDIRKDLNNYLTNKDATSRNINNYTNINNNAEKLHPTDEALLLTPEQNKTFIVQTPEGSVDFTTDEALKSFAEFEKYSSIEKEGGPARGRYVYRVDDTQAMKDLSISVNDSPEEAQKKRRKQAMYNAWRKDQPDRKSDDVDFGFEFSDFDGNPVDLGDVSEYIKDTRDLLKPIMREKTKKKDKYIANKLKEATPTYGSTAYGVPLKNKEAKNEFISDVLAPLQKLDDGAGIPGFSGNIAGYINYLEGTFIETNSDGTYSLNVSAPKYSEDVLTIPLDQKMYDDLFLNKYEPSEKMKTFQNKYVPLMLDNTPSVEPVYEDNGQPKIDDYGNPVFREKPKNFWTSATNSAYNTNLGNAALKQEDGHFRNVGLYTVSGNTISDVKPTNAKYVYLKLNITDPRDPDNPLTNITLPGEVAVDAIDDVINSISDLTIWQLLNKTKKAMPQEEYESLVNAASNIKIK